VRIGILHVATNLGLRPGGVENLGSVLLELGLADRLGAAEVKTLRAPPFQDARDPVFGTRNLQAIGELARDQADVLHEMLDGGTFPLVLGGDDSVLLGCLLALRRQGTAGLVFIDGHTDFWDLANSLAGEFSESDLRVATGHGPDIVAELEGFRPLVEPRACAVYGHRDREEQLEQGSEDVYRQPMLVRNLAELRGAGMEDAAAHAVAFIENAGARDVWVHIDADCLDDQLMPAVDWRAPGGLSEQELLALLRALLCSESIAGVDVTIYNPSLDTRDRSAGQVLSRVLVEAMNTGLSGRVDARSQG
jgi:arginase